jgi:hypothetical protein
MQSSLEKLRKFFNLEHQNGYNDNAIIGGLAKMLDYWEGEARVDKLSEEIIQAVVQRLQSYGKLSPESRAESLKGLWKRIGDQYPEATQKQARAPRPQPRPVSPPKETPSAPADLPPSWIGETEEGAKKERPAPPGRAETAPGGRTSPPLPSNADPTVPGVDRAMRNAGKLGLYTLGACLLPAPLSFSQQSPSRPFCQQ